MIIVSLDYNRAYKVVDYLGTQYGEIWGTTDKFPKLLKKYFGCTYFEILTKYKCCQYGFPTEDLAVAFKLIFV